MESKSGASNQNSVSASFLGGSAVLRATVTTPATSNPDLAQLAAPLDSTSQSLIVSQPMGETRSPVVKSIPTAPEIDSVIPSTSTPAMAEPPSPLVPLLEAWLKPLLIGPELKDPIPHDPPSTVKLTEKGLRHSDILPPEVKEDGKLRFSWAAKMDPKSCNLHRTTSPCYLEDGTPMVVIPDHVLMYGLENQKEYVIGQFYRCSPPSGGLIHAVTNRIWGKNCQIFTRKLGDSSYLFHISNASTRTWVLERGLWHIDGCIMFVAPWSPSASLALPEITSIPIWVTLKNIPSCLNSLWGISWIASGLGEPMLSDKTWLDLTKMGEAKLMVEVELDKEFPQRIAAGDKIGNITMVSVEYSWIPSKCERCGNLGHRESRCLFLSKPVSNDLICSLANASIDATILVNEVAATPIVTASEVVIAPAANLGSSHGSPLAFAPTHTSIGVANDTTTTFVAAPTVTTLASTYVVAEPLTPPPMFAPPLAMVTANTPPLSDSFNEFERNVSGSNCATLDTGSMVEMGEASQKTRGGRIIKPTLKLQEMEWTKVEGRKSRGRSSSS